MMHNNGNVYTAKKSLMISRKPAKGHAQTTQSTFMDGGISEVGYAVGTGGVIVKANNVNNAPGNWAQKDFPASPVEDLNALHIINFVGYIVGDNGTILKTEDFANPGEQWSALTTPSGDDWVSFNCSSCNTAEKRLNDVHFKDYQTGYALGNNGLLLKTHDGGVTWGNEPTNTTQDLNAMTSTGTGDNTYFIGGSASTAIHLLDNKDRISTRFYYDRLGRLVASQNTKQFNANPKKWSYTKYDFLGRIIEVGELESNDEPDDNLLNNPTYPDLWNVVRTQVTKTSYDKPYYTGVSALFGPEGQQNLRTRVASVMYYDAYDVTQIPQNKIDYRNATHYSYDIHGNVKALIQENRDLDAVIASGAKQSLKRIDYDYDLVSGNVNKVSYQKGQPDQFFHRYQYDADNRIVSVETSVNGLQWDKDAAYKYYHHGPLARMELGDEKVQGIDYAYTLQGWIKGVNSNTLKAHRDIGKDGASASLSNLNRYVARDAFGYSLGYYNGDYSPVGFNPSTQPDKGNFFLAATDGNTVLNGSTASDAPDLFNGNIAQMVTTIVNPMFSMCLCGSKTHFYFARGQEFWCALNETAAMLFQC